MVVSNKWDKCFWYVGSCWFDDNAVYLYLYTHIYVGNFESDGESKHNIGNGICRYEDCYRQIMHVTRSAGSISMLYRKFSISWYRGQTVKSILHQSNNIYIIIASSGLTILPLFVKASKPLSEY